MDPVIHRITKGTVLWLLNESLCRPKIASSVIMP